MMSITKKNQEDHVKEEEMCVPEMITERLRLPNIKELHLQTTEDIAATLAMVIKARSNIVELRYKLGEYIELVTSSR